MMTLEEAIEHCEQNSCDNSLCSMNHKQLAEWLKELQASKTNNTSSKEMEERYPLCMGCSEHNEKGSRRLLHK